MNYAHRHDDSRPPQLHVHLDDGILFVNKDSKDEYLTIMRKLAALFQDKVATSNPGDMTLDSASNHNDALEMRFSDELLRLYSAKGFSATEVDDCKGRLFDAAIQLKPKYDEWALRHPIEFGGP